MNLRNAAFSASRWMTLAAVSRAILQLIQTIVLARLLAPADFGLMAMAGAAMSVAVLLADLGLGSALMHFPIPNRRTLSTLYWLNFGIACLLALLFTILARPLAGLYDQMELQPVLVLLAISLPLSAAGLPFRVLAEKGLQFRPLAQNEIIAGTLGLLSALALAVAGGGVYALVAATLVTAGMGSLLAWARLSAGLRPDMTFRFSLARPYIGFGLHRIGDGFWNALRIQADIFIAGLVAGPGMVGHYAVPRDLCLKVANTIINPVITRIGLPVMTQLQHDQAALRSVYLKALRTTASFNFPAYALLALFAEDVVALLLGDQWQDAAFYMRLFAIWGLIRSTGNPSGSLLYAVGMAKRAHIWNLLLFFVTVPMLWVAAKLAGLPGLAWTMVVMQAGIFWLAWRYLVRPACGASFLIYGASVSPPLVATLMATLITVATLSFVPDMLRLATGATLFSVTYIVLSWRLNREWLRLVAELIGPIRRLLPLK